MYSPRDFSFAEQARRKIMESNSAPHRAELALQQATADAEQIKDRHLRKDIMTEIRKAQGKWTGGSGR